MAGGRPSSLTIEVIELLERGISIGMPYDLACVRAGITFQTFNEWSHGRFPRSSPKELRQEFSDRIKRAEAQGCYELLLLIRSHAGSNRAGNWTAAAWMLERRYPEHFGRRTISQITGTQGGPVQVDQQMTLTLREIADELAREDASIDPAEALDEAVAHIAAAQRNR